MRALGRKTLKSKIEREAERSLQEHYTQFAYEILSRQATCFARQNEAMFLLVLSQMGYGRTRLHRVHERICAAARTEEVLGKTVRTKDCEAFMTQEYGIDFSQLTVNFPDYETFREQFDGKP